jgi:ABC-type uncharacterized transport system substrate-binding protein
MTAFIGRRQFVTLLGGAAATWAGPARAQRERVRRVAVILPYPKNDTQSQARIETFRAALQQAGWIEGQDLVLEVRWDATDVERIRSHAVELANLKPDVIVANSTPVVSALFRETRVVPIVFVSVTDPVGQGFVQTFARPGGNVTGFTNIEPSFGGKLVDMLKEIAPSVIWVASLYTPGSSWNRVGDF